MKTIDTQLAAQRADDFFHSGWNCAESVFLAIHEQAGEGQAPVRLLTPLGGGMGSKRTCGALGGAMVSLGLVCGRTTPDEAAKKAAYAQASALCKSFRERFHSIDCWELTSPYDNEPDRKRACTGFVRTAVELVGSASAGSGAP